VGVLKLAARASDRAGEFELALQIAAPDGPAADVRATLFRAVRSEDGWSDRTFEVQGKSDASGRVHLAGQHVGKKILVVDARDRGFTRVQREVELAPGAHTLSIALERGLEIRGRLVDVNGAPILRPPGESRYGDALQLHAVDPAVPGEWIFAALEDDGRFAFTALDALEYELDVSNGPWSSLCLDGVRAGTRDLLITLKRHDDPLARGNHCAEIHARLVDDATGKPVPVDIWAYEVAPLDPGTTTTTFDRDVAASLRLDRPAQRSLSGPQPPDSDHVHATSLDAGTYAFVVRAAGYAAEFAAPIVLAPHEMRNDVVLRLVQPTRVRGRVLDDVGRPCAGAFVFVNGIGAASAKRTQEFDRDVAETDGHPRAAVWELVQTDARGEFTIDGLSPRYDYVCEALHAQYRPVTGSKFSGQDPGVVELRFAKQR
jgi:hypothetical protein